VISHVLTIEGTIEMAGQLEAGEREGIEEITGTIGEIGIIGEREGKTEITETNDLETLKIETMIKSPKHLKR
jgi:hypothetical protein